MNKVFCDFCGKEIEPELRGLIRVRWNRFLSLKVYSPENKEWLQNEICEECAGALGDWIKNRATLAGRLH